MGIDNAFVANLNVDDGVDVTATLVLKTAAVEMLGVGFLDLLVPTV